MTTQMTTTMVKRSRTEQMAARNAVMSELAAVKDADRAAMRSNPDDPRHGTRNGYRICRCRCDTCTAQATLRNREYAKRAEKKERRQSSAGEVDDRLYGVSHTGRVLISPGVDVVKLTAAVHSRPKPAPSGMKFERRPFDVESVRARGAGAV